MCENYHIANCMFEPLIFLGYICTPTLAAGPVNEGLGDFYQKDFCSGAVWEQYYADFKRAIDLFNGGNIKTAAETFAIETMSPLVANPALMFNCSTAVGAGALFLGNCYERLGDGVRALRARQAASIFASFDFQMKGQEYIDSSVWPIRWEETVDSVIRSMTWFLSSRGNADTLRDDIEADGDPLQKSEPMSIAIVTVCDYDSEVTPLSELSRLNKEKYAKLHGYSLIYHNKAPIFQDYFTRNANMYTSRPHAWSKIDAVMGAMADEAQDYDWVMWMDCDSYFLDTSKRLEDVILAARRGPSVKSGARQGVSKLANWAPTGSPGSVDEATREFNQYASSLVSQEWDAIVASNPSIRCATPQSHCVTELVASEDGLMLNTGIFFLRKSVFSFLLLARVRQLLFNKSPATFHPWWEQTGLILLLSAPFTFGSEWDQASANHGYAEYTSLVPQRAINVYPPMIAGMLKTHVAHSDGDFIVSFSGCKVYSSPSVCNHLFIEYFLKADGTDPEEVGGLIQKFYQ